MKLFGWQLGETKFFSLGGGEGDRPDFTGDRVTLATRRGTRVTRGFARESHRTPGTDGDGDMGEVKLPEDVKEQLEKFEAAVEEMEKGLKPLLSADRKEMEAALDPLERARVHIALANSVSTLYASE